jgi:GNAT superfamily N-acetyltransferase
VRDVIQLKRRENSHFLEYLSTTGLAGVFARWVVQEKPNAHSIGAFLGNDLVGAAIPGPSIGLPQASSCWVFTERSDVFTSLFGELLEDRVGPVNFPLRHLESVPTGLEVTIDNYYAISSPGAKAWIDTAEVEWLSPKRLRRVTIPDEMDYLIGCIDEIPDDFPYCGIVRDNTVVALAEAVVRDSEVATIQQVFTIAACRGQGLGRAVVEFLARTLIDQRITPTYLASADNEESNALARTVGFELESRWGFAYLDAEESSPRI